MYRLLPLFLIFLFFFLIFGIVINLTTTKYHKDMMEDENISKIEALHDEKSQSEVTDENISKIETFSSEKSQSEDTLENAFIRKKEYSSSDQKLILDNQEIKIQRNEVLDTKKLDSQMFIVQFGVFSQKKGAENLKKKIDTDIKKKYNYFESDLLFNNQKQKYYLVYETKVKRSAKNVCIYSKELKIDCYVRKK